VSALSILAIALAGTLGALSRVGLTELAGGDLLHPGTLTITLLINVLGALLLALLRRHSRHLSSPALVDGIGIGFLGAFTTWSAAMAASALAYGAGDALLAIGYLVASVGAGIVAAYIARGPLEESHS
jgi:CrcB protein